MSKLKIRNKKNGSFIEVLTEIPSEYVTNTELNSRGFVTDYSLKYNHYDGTNLFGWGSTASDGEDMTSNYGMTASEVASVYIGATYEWNSRLSYSANNYGQVTYCVSDYGYSDDGTYYDEMYIVMNGNDYNYLYNTDLNQVWKGYSWGEDGAVACFTGDTPVLTREGLKAIKDIKVGDMVPTVNKMKTSIVEKPIVKLVNHDETEIYKIYVDGEVIETTASHPFITKEKGRCNARILEKGMTLRTFDGSGKEIIDIVIENRNEKVYEVVVEDTHNYFVGNSNIQVYNEPSTFQ